MLANLSKHPEARNPANRAGLRDANRDVEANLQKLEALKPSIKRRYDRYKSLVKERDARRTSLAKERGGTGGRDRLDVLGPDSVRYQQQVDPALAGKAKTLEAGENRDFAVRLAQREFSRRATVRKAAGSAREGDGWMDQNKNKEADDLSSRLQAVRPQVDWSSNIRFEEGAVRRQAERSVSQSYDYPTVPKKSAFDYQSPPVRPPPVPPLPSKDGEALPTYTPTLPPKPPLQDFQHPSQQDSSFPARPEKVILAPTEPSPPPRTTTPGDLSSSKYTFKPSAYLENGNPLRTVFLPPRLRHEFESLALSNTRSNLETCGFLCGTLISNALFISKLVIPEQISTSDTCEMINESALFDYCDSEDLLVLGWIHTHPTQTCFMSSRDLHTHVGLQVMMPEAIAIVCAPGKGE